MTPDLLIEVEACSPCPFYYDSWCTHPRAQSKTDDTDVDSVYPPVIPAWCPLRDQPALVRLKAKAEP